VIRPVVADANTLFGATTRGLLIHLDYGDLIRLHWSPLILDELARALVDTRRKKTLKEARAHEARMRDALPRAWMSKAEVQAQVATVAHAVRSPKDVHVAACALGVVAGKAYPEATPIALVTRNISDFRKGALAKLGIALNHPDEFLEALLQSRPQDFIAAFRRFRIDLKSRPAPEALLQRLQADGQVRTANALKSGLQAGEWEL
jgi:hypothetical protein